MLSGVLKLLLDTYLHKQGWVTVGSSPSLPEATIQSTSALDESTFLYEVNFKERNGAYEGSQIHQMLTIKKYIIDQKDYWFISDVIGDLDYYTVL